MVQLPASVVAAAAAGLTLSSTAVLGASIAAALVIGNASPPPSSSGRIAWDDSQPLAAGRILAVDSDASRLAIEHGAIRHLSLPPGTALFRLEDPQALVGLTPGDKIRFVVEREGRTYFITRLENSN